MFLPSIWHLSLCISLIPFASCKSRDVRRAVQNADAEIAAFVSFLKVPQDIVEKVTTTLNENPDVVAFLNNGTHLDNDVTASELTPVSCRIAQLILGSEIVHIPVPQELVEVNWSQTSWLTPQCIISPSTASSVSLSLHIFTFLRTPFAVRSGGHSPNPGFSSIGAGGVLVELGNLTQITLNKDQSVASIGPGLRWAQVYEALDASRVTVIGGRIATVGVGGLILGGGLSHFSAEYGLAADNVQNFEIVLPNGTITDANSDENPDLFWALKGGGPNFGIVTRFDLYTVPIRAIWYAASIYPTSQALAILAAFVQYQNEGALDPKSSITVQLNLVNVVVIMVYSSHSNQPAAFAPFFAMPDASPVLPPTNGTVVELTQRLASLIGLDIIRHDFRTASSTPDLSLYTQHEAYWRERATAIHAATGANMTWVLQNVAVSAIELGIQKGGNALGLQPIKQQWWGSEIDWVDPADDATIREAVISIGDKWAELGAPRGSYLPHIFMNDASFDQNPLAGYGAENLARLRDVAGRYDPRGVMQILQRDGFLLRKA